MTTVWEYNNGNIDKRITSDAMLKTREARLDRYFADMEAIVGGTITGFVRDNEGFYGFRIEQKDSAFDEYPRLLNVWIAADDGHNNPGSVLVVHNARMGVRTETKNGKGK